MQVACRLASGIQQPEALEVTADGKGLVGHAGGMLLRKLADQCGLTAALEGALQLRRTKPAH